MSDLTTTDAQSTETLTPSVADAEADQATASAATAAEEPQQAAEATPAEADAVAAEEETSEAQAEGGEEVEAKPEGGESAEAKPEEEPKNAEAAVEATTGAEETSEAKTEEETETVEVQAAETKPGEEAETAEAKAGEQTAEAEAGEEAEAAAGAPPSGGVIAVEQDAQPGETMTLLEQAQKNKTPVEGQIIGWNKGGYHVAVGKIAAFCPVSQIEVGNPRSPKRYLDKSFPFLVIEIQDGGRRVVVSRAAALEAARVARAALVREHLKPGSNVSGKVSSLTDFGAFIDLGGGIEGLVHVSELSRRRVDHPKELLKKGQKVEVTVLKIENSGERISLSMKRLEPDPWAGVAKRFPSGSEFTGKILRKADFGLFVEVEPGLEGLVHTSRLPIGKDLSDEAYEIGAEVSGWIHDVEAKRRRLSLSLRELATQNPWRDVANRYPIGEVAKGKVERLASFGVFIELEPGLTGLLPFSVLSTRAGNPRRMFHPGKEVSVRVMSIDRDKRRISLGTETSQAEGSQQDFKEYLKTQKSSRSPKAGLGSLAAAFAKARSEQHQV